MCLGSLVACGELPKPFSHSVTGTRNPLISLSGVGAIRVRVDESLPESLAKPLIDSMIKSLWTENVPASAAANFRPHYLLDGNLNISHPSVSHPEQIEVIWTLSDRSGKKLSVFDHRFSGNRAGWLFFDKNLLTDLVADMGKEVAQQLYAQQKPKISELKIPTSAKNTPDQIVVKSSGAPSSTVSENSSDSVILRERPRIFLAEIIGAPGDGNNSLFRNMQRFMIVAGASVVSERLKSHYLVKGFVNVSPPYNASNDVAITWLVTTNEGQELGKVTQNNKVPVGALEGRWGDIAHIVAQGGSVGIIDIVEQHLAPSDNKEEKIVFQ